MKCPNCGFDSPPEMRFCGMCGSRLARVCPDCGFANPHTFRFCGMCSANLNEAPAPMNESLAEAAATLAPQLPHKTEQATLPTTDLEPTAPSTPAIQLEGERRVATVILADVTGSTDLLEQVGTEAWVEIMNRVLYTLESEIYRFDGQVDQFRGDGLVAFFGATSAHEDDPERAVLAALAMQEAIKPYAAELAERQGIGLRLRVGVNTGEVIVTSVGDRRQYSEDTAMGEAITIAARMETAAEPGTVLVSANTYRLVEAQFEWQSLGEITVKGISQPIPVYRPLAPQADPGYAYGRAVPMIGRDAEFQTLKGCVEGLYAGRGGIVEVTGEKGMGKSLLVAQVRQHFVRHGALLAEAYDRDLPPPASLTWLRGRCRSFDQSWPFSMWLSLLRNWLGMRRGEPHEETRDRLRRQAEALWGDRLAEHYPYLATFLSLPLEETFVERIQHLDAEGWHQQFFLTIRHWVEAMARRGPLVLAFADVHWADTASLELLKYCLPLCDHEALLWLIVFRPDRTSPVWELRHYVETEYPHRLTTLTLPPLTETQSSKLVDQLIGPNTLPAETWHLVLGKAEGNPYFIRELVQALIARGVLVQDPATGRWRATHAADSLDLPDSLQSLLLARIDQLSPAERHALQMAAVIGPTFWSNVLEDLAGDAAALNGRKVEPGALKGHLTTLQREGLIQERGRVLNLGMEYFFNSSLIRDAAYEGLLSTQRVTYHRRVAEYLEKIFGDDTLSHYYSALAYHYRRAGAQRKELFYTLLAAEQAREIYANFEALEHYTRALDLLNQMETEATDDSQLYTIRTQRFEVLNGRREVFFLLGNLDAARFDAQALLHLAQQLKDDPAWLIDALLQQPSLVQWKTREELDAGIAMAEEALALAQQLNDRRREMQSLAAIANQRLWINDPTAWELAERALELARQLGDQRYEVGILIGMGGVYEWSDQPERGMAYLEAAIPICQALGDKMAEIDLLYLLGLQFERSGDYYRLLTEYHQKRLDISRKIGHRHAEAAALMQCGQTRGLYLGDYETGFTLLEESRRIWGDTVYETSVWVRIAQTYVAQGRLDEALEALEHAQHIASVRAVKDMGRAGLLLVSAMLYNVLGDTAHLHQALELTQQTCQLVAAAPLTRQYEMAAACETAATHLRLAEGAADEAESSTEATRQQHLHQALQASQAALDIYQHFGFVQIIECISEEILFRHSRALAANGREAEAAEYLQRAHDEMMRKHDLLPPDSPLRRSFLENIPLHRDIGAAYADSLEERA